MTIHKEQVFTTDLFVVTDMNVLISRGYQRYILLKYPVSPPWEKLLGKRIAIIYISLSRELLNTSSMFKTLLKKVADLLYSVSESEPPASSPQPSSRPASRNKKSDQKLSSRPAPVSAPEPPRPRPTLSPEDEARYNMMTPEQIFAEALSAYNRDEHEVYVPLFMKLAEEGYAPAFAYAGIALEFGILVDPDEQQMLQYYRKSIDAHHYVGLYRMSEYYKSHGMYNELFALCHQAYEEGWTFSEKWGEAGLQYLLGECYENGWGVAPDLETAIEYYRKSSAGNNPDAEDALERLGAKYDASEFELELPQAERLLPARELYLMGYREYWNRKLPLALAHFKASAAKGFALSACYIARILGDKDQLCYNPEQASQYAAQADEGLLPLAQQDPSLASDCGNCFLHGKGCSKDLTKARKCYEIGVEHNDMHCQYQLGKLMTDEGRWEQAFHLFLQSAEQGQGMAMFEVAKCYEEGLGTSMDLSAAKQWYQRCAANKNYAAASDAQKRLDNCG